MKRDIFFMIDLQRFAQIFDTSYASCAQLGTLFGSSRDNDAASIRDIDIIDLLSIAGCPTHLVVEFAQSAKMNLRSFICGA